MSIKMVNVGARVPQADAEFISQIHVEGAKTPSDKVRALISEARRRHEGLHDYQASLDSMISLLSPISGKARQMEADHSVHSEMVMRTLEWLPDITAYILSSNDKLDQSGEQALIEMEKGITDRVFRLMESILQMGVTQRCPCYDRLAILNRIEPILDLAKVIERTHSEISKGD